MLTNKVTDQAEGLRRILAGQSSRTMAFLSAIPVDLKNAVLLNLATSLAKANSDVHLLDACQSPQGISVGTPPHLPQSLWDVAQECCSAEAAILEHSPGVHIAKLADQSLASLAQQPQQPDKPEHLDKLDLLLKATFKASSFSLVDTDIDHDNALVLPALAAAEMVVLVTVTTESIKNAYALVKTVHAQLGLRTFSMLVVGATPAKANLIQHNMGIAANQYLGVKLVSLGCIPPDEQLSRSSHVGRAMVEAFPMSPAAVAFRALAGRLIDHMAAPQLSVKPKPKPKAGVAA
jgi:flagellar biosynthesis protein FlhG